MGSNKAQYTDGLTEPLQSIEPEKVDKNSKKLVSEEQEQAHWIHCEVFKEALRKTDEPDRSEVKEYCLDLYTEGDTFTRITAKRSLLEDYESLCETTEDPDPFIFLGNLLAAMTDYERAEHFYSKVLSSTNENKSEKIKILNKLSIVYRKTNQLDKLRSCSEQINAINQ